MKFIPWISSFLSLAIGVTGCASSRSESWLKDARLELAPPMPDPFLPAPKEGRLQANLGYAKLFDPYGSFAPDKSSGSFPLSLDSNLYWGSLGYEHSTAKEDHERLAVRLSRWNSVWCGEVGVLVDFGQYTMLGSMGLEWTQSNHSITDSIVVHNGSFLDNSVLYTEQRRYSNVEDRIAFVPSLSIAKTLGTFQPWAAGVFEYRSSSPEAPSSDPSLPSSAKHPHGTWGGFAQILGGMRWKLSPSWFLSTSGGWVVAVGDYDLDSPKASFSLTYSR